MKKWIGKAGKAIWAERVELLKLALALVAQHFGWDHADLLIELVDVLMRRKNDRRK